MPKRAQQDGAARTRRLRLAGGAAIAAVILAAMATRSPSLGAANATPMIQTAAQRTGAPACDADNGGLTLPAGFCATIFADSIGGARHMVVASNGDLLVGRNRSRADSLGGVTLLRDSTGDGHADLKVRVADGGGTEVALHDGSLFATGARGTVLRYPYKVGSTQTSGPADTVIAGMPQGGHSSYNFVVDGNMLYLNVGSRTNSCQEQDRKSEVPGADPCTELETRAGIWKFDANGKGQTQAQGERFATGIRNAVALARNPADGQLYAVFHGRDGLGQQWGKLYSEDQSAEKPSEEFIHITKGANFGWPYCYHDPELGRLVLAPEYGGDGSKPGRCTTMSVPLAAFPAHWAPNALLFYTGTQFPAAYRSGAFVAFHGSWNRAPKPQAGYRVSFVPFRNGKPTGAAQTFADGFAGPGLATGGAARHRPTGLAMAPDGALYVSDDAGGRIWRIIYTGASR